MKKTISFLLAFLFTFSYTVQAMATMQYVPSCEIHSEAIYLADENGNVLYEQNSHQRMYPAELTQIMTAIVVIENIDHVGGWEKQGVYDMAIQNFLYDNRHGIIATGMLSGDVFTADELFYDLMIAAGYDAAMILAEIVAGNEENFVKMMNEKAAEIGAKDTNFSNCHGLHNTANYTTAYDMYLISRYAMELDKFREVTSKTSYICEATDTHQKLIWNSFNGLIVSGNIHYYAPVIGIKAGFSSDIGRNVVSYAEYEGFSYYQVNLGAPFELDDGFNLAFVDAKNLYMWAFTEFTVKTIVESGSQIAEVPLELAWKKDHLPLVIGDTYRTLLPNDIDVSSISYTYDLPESVEAPIEEGEKIGTLNLMLAGEIIGSVPLIAGESVEQSDLLSGLKNFSDMTRSFWFKLILCIIGILIVLYIALMVVRNYNHRKYGNFKRKKHF